MVKRIILPYGYGQTCNQLFQIAHWIPIANEYGIPLFFPGFQRYAHMFCGTEKLQYPRFPQSALDAGFVTLLFRLFYYTARIPRVNIGFLKLCSMLPGVVLFSSDDKGSNGVTEPLKVVQKYNVSDCDSLLVQGWLFRDHVGVVKHKKCIKEFFSPVHEIQHRVDTYIKNKRYGELVLVGVHLRRGDYSKWADGKYYYDDITVCAIMRQMSGLLYGQKVRFILVSNQQIDLRNYKGLDIVMGPGDTAGDLYSLAACDYIIGPPSTFTNWASFYGNVPLYIITDPKKKIKLDDLTVCSG